MTPARHDRPEVILAVPNQPMCGFHSSVSPFTFRLPPFTVPRRPPIFARKPNSRTSARILVRQAGRVGNMTGNALGGYSRPGFDMPTRPRPAARRYSLLRPKCDVRGRSTAHSPQPQRSYAQILVSRRRQPVDPSRKPLSRRCASRSFVFLSSKWPVPMPSDWLERMNWPQTLAEEEGLRLTVKRGRPFGDESWQRRCAADLGLESSLRATGRPRGSEL